MSGFYPLLLAVGVLAGCVAARADEDTVVYTAGPEARGRLTVSGTILDYTGEQLRIRTDAGRELVVPTDRISEIKTKWTAAYEDGDRLFAAGDFAAAIDKYRQALRDEQRVWAERQILARSVRACCHVEDYGRAGELFLRLVTSDRATQHFEVIPLAWWPHRPAPGLQQQAAGWLANSREPVAQLLGASWLLESTQRPAAVAALEQLQKDRDRRVSQLAETQRWRTRCSVASEDEVRGWETAIGRLRADLRAGPYFLLGQGWSTVGHHEQAVLAFLRCPVLYPGDRRVAASALLSAARELETIGQRDEAAGLLRELRQRYPDSRAAAECGDASPPAEKRRPAVPSGRRPEQQDR